MKNVRIESKSARLYLCLALALCAACSEQPSTTDTDVETETDVDTDPPADTDPPTETGTTPVANTYSSDWAGMELLYADHCDVCHPSVQGIDLHADTAYWLVPGDASASTLWLDVAGLGFSVMPKTGLLPSEDVAHVEEWINDGAVID